jgi:hypothetical protein
MARLSPITTALLVALLSSLAVQAQPAERKSSTPAQSIWQQETTPSIGAANVLESLSADSESDIWSVGDFVSLRFDGLTWTAFPLVAFQTQQPSEDTMNGVTAISPTDVWAVGDALEETVSGGSHFVGMIEQFDGSQWNLLPSPQLASGVELNAIQAISATDIYAAGDSHADSQQPNPFLEHYDGVRWSVVPLPHLPKGSTGRLRGIAIISASDIWVTGDSGGAVPTALVAMHFNGQKWSIVPVPLPLNGKVHDVGFGKGVTAIATDDVWAVGAFTSLAAGVEQTLTEHWDGQAWKVVPSPNAGSGSANLLAGVAAISSTDVWACGQTDATNPFALVNLIEHWDGTRWTISPVTAGNGFAGLFAMLAFPSGSVYAAGSDFDNNNLISVVFHTTQGK